MADEPTSTPTANPERPVPTAEAPVAAKPAEVAASPAVAAAKPAAAEKPAVAAAKAAAAAEKPAVAAAKAAAAAEKPAVAAAKPAPARPAPRPAAQQVDERPYEESLWQRGQQLYFRLLDMDSGRSRVDPTTIADARTFASDAETVLREKLEDYDGFVERVRISEQFYSDVSRVKKNEVYLKQLFLRKSRIEELARTLGR